jgi:hypothetical protein
MFLNFTTALGQKLRAIENSLKIGLNHTRQKVHEQIIRVEKEWNEEGMEREMF